MPRRVFFSFHYELDSWRASIVRNCNVIKSGYEKNDFMDGSAWESLKRSGDQAIQRWISHQLKGTSVTVVLIGSETDQREWVLYEIEKSLEKNNGLLGVRIHNISDNRGNTDYKGGNPFRNFYINGNTRDNLSKYINVYDWVNDDGRENLGDWIEDAAQQVNR